MCLYKILDVDIDGADEHEEGYKDDEDDNDKDEKEDEFEGDRIRMIKIKIIFYKIIIKNKDEKDKNIKMIMKYRDYKRYI